MFCVDMFIQSNFLGGCKSTMVTLNIINSFIIDMFIFLIFSTLFFCFYIMKILALIFSVTSCLGSVIPAFPSVSSFRISLFTFSCLNKCLAIFFRVGKVASCSLFAKASVTENNFFLFLLYFFFLSFFILD